MPVDNGVSEQPYNRGKYNQDQNAGYFYAFHT
jgi:hypothetical protein